MRNLIIKISTWAFLAGLVFTGMGVWEIIKERNVSQTPSAIQSSDVNKTTEELAYATIQGGRLDLANTYEYSLQTKKSDVKLNSDYFIPVKDTETDAVIYVLKTSDEPSIEDVLKTANFSGLLQNRSELPSKILDAYKKEFPNVDFAYLDTTYKPETLIEKIKGLGIFLGLLLGGLVIRTLATKKPESIATENAANP
ncbi:hypothetical protein [Litoribrevibacter albus]|uniref:Uncharacterized protein n=1 Tax=Litoribrevibacter albus TaxID=1473156 RepID=A0AA37SAZ0_9GAMM|nr:hypothetical protein [Litoribrevibacter albus]GLQ32632.1 hypothetical protein GCM10007876_31110 [Litoribrevibacter albus]